jgi:uncharacterized protein (TIGR03083 family)
MLSVPPVRRYRMSHRPVPAYPDLVSAASAQWGRLAAAVAALPRQEYAEPTRLAGWRVAELVAHLVGNAEAVTRGLAALPPLAASVTAVTYYDHTEAEAPEVDARARAGADGASAERLRDAEDQAAAALAGADPQRLVASRFGGIRLADFLETRCVEAVVHGLDLGVEPDPAALRIVVRLLAAVLAARAPGRTVELRVPPYAAVQCLAGPRHTRGTPPNVVEADPIPFVEVATGRADWAEAVRDGGVRASGARSDLSGLLPLLG